MRLTDDFHDEPSSGLPVVYMAVGGTLFVFLVLAVVLFVNREPKRSPAGSNVAAVNEQTTEMSEGTADTGKLTSDQLSIWDEFATEAGSEGGLEAGKLQTQEEESSVEEESVEDPSKGGTRTMIINDKGAEEWIAVNPYLSKSKYDFTNLVYQEPLMKYYEDGRQVSYMGVDISKEQGFVDYNKLKKAGIQFVILRVGARGYGSGQLSVDESFPDNLKGAIDAGLNIGVYFYSQAVSVEEAQEEAKLVLDQIEEYPITYPVAYDMEKIDHDTARTDQLKKEEKTEIAGAFLKAVKESGYKPVLYGDKEWLMTEIDLMKLIEFDVWLSQEKDVPDYPYKFSIWQYTTNGQIDGISGKANLNISFIDYELK